MFFLIHSQLLPTHNELWLRRNGLDGITQRFFCSAIVHSTPDEQAPIYKLLLDHPTAKEWAKT